ncbi:arylamine N-acetyltransferase [Micromonospora citrea]|uniref:Arylamine N-acetyltransferase n=2 Tax=Micromonospora citrea TaxID=47855 RepID=A0A1C6VVF7_9ACTN|nr:arylamine N-acetyltransferase [Micromonospora citrea]
MDTPMTASELHAYLRRIDVADLLGACPEPTLGTLETVVAGHIRSIPFETLDPALGRPVADLRTGALVEKLVHRHRGGYCYEQNGLLSGALLALGYDVAALTGRVVWKQPDDAPPTPRTHLALAVAVPTTGERYLVDVGFGAQTLSAPIRIDGEGPQPTRHEPYRLVAMPDGWRRLEAEIRGTWRPLYVLGPDAQARIDLEVGSWYVSTHPESAFVRGLSAGLVADDARWGLRGNLLRVHRRTGDSERVVLGSAAAVIEVLTGRFGIDVTGLGDVEARLTRLLSG